MKKTVLNIAVTAVFVALICASAQITVPLPSGVPVTLQTLAIALCGYCLGIKKSLCATLTYLLMGVVGLPVFSGFNAGAGALFGKTGGFIIGFVFLSFACSAACEMKNKLLKILCGFVGLILCHLVGILLFSYITKMPFFPAALAVSVPFLAKDAVCIAVSAVLSEKIKKIIGRL